jgi:hypothetical protein
MIEEEEEEEREARARLAAQPRRVGSAQAEHHDVALTVYG